ncbi:MAG: TonB-dependent receptor plug domain-containing protein [Chlorobi bacterium]|nr:TonB-dependent receptor plug domain-containing protein [Chlorobiota bacterium]
MKRTLLFLLWITVAAWSPAQQSGISGKVVSASGDPLAGVHILVKDTKKGTVTDLDGRFRIVPEKYPATLVFSYLGYKRVEKTFTGPASGVRIVMEESAEPLEETVITASRTEEKLKESPVTIEVMTPEAVELSVAPSFYDELVKLRGVQANTNSLTFQALNTRGFATFANNRMLQIIDGIDNSSPALNFPLGNLVGISDLDVESVELLPGTSSALYGANAFNGLIYIRSKNPFDYPGVSVSVKSGITRQEWGGIHPLHEAAVRYARAGRKWAWKFNLSVLDATDWTAKDYTDYDMHPRNADKRGSRESNPSYDGLNVYGDEVATDIDLSAFGLGIIRVSRTGYEEEYLTDYKARSFKTDFAVHHRPKGKDHPLELMWVSRFGSGQTIYQGSNRFNLKDFIIHQHKLELRNRNYFVRAYYTGENAGSSYDMRFAAIHINRAWKSDYDWFRDYAGAYVVSRRAGLSEDEAHLQARAYADRGRFLPGTREFDSAFVQVTSTPGFTQGARFIDRTSLFHTEGNYDFRNLFPQGLLQVGGSYRQFNLRSDGTIFTDYDGPIHIREVGAYVQYIQKLFDKHAKVSASLRYDRQDRFTPNLSPRLAVVVMPDADRAHAFRIAYQTGFRNPTTQDWYIGLDVGRASLVGAHPANWDRYREQWLDNHQQPYTITGRDAYTNSYTLASFLAFAATWDPTVLEAADIKPLGPEKIRSIEIGYRGKLKEWLDADLVYYFNDYQNFITQQAVVGIPSSYGSVHDSTGLRALGLGAYRIFGVFTNVDVPVRSRGFDMHLHAAADRWEADFIYSYAKLLFDRERYPDYTTYFNTPENTYKLILTARDIYPRLTASMSILRMDGYIWESSFATGPVPPRTTVDAVLAYRIPRHNLLLKAGGTNIFGPDYVVAPGTGKVGSIYYLSLMWKSN